MAALLSSRFYSPYRLRRHDDIGLPPVSLFPLLFLRLGDFEETPKVARAMGEARKVKGRHRWACLMRDLPQEGTRKRAARAPRRPLKRDEERQGFLSQKKKEEEEKKYFESSGTQDGYASSISVESPREEDHGRKASF